MSIMLTKPADSMRRILNAALKNVEPSLSIDQQTVAKEEHWAKQTCIPNAERKYHPYYDLSVVYGGNVLVQTDKTTRHHYDFLVKEMSATAFFGVAVDALQDLFKAEYETI
jgi:hypothetical protein